MTLHHAGRGRGPTPGRRFPSVAPARLVAATVFVSLAAGCATTKESEVRALWLPASQEAWSRIAPDGLTLRLRDGGARHVPAPVIRNIVAVKSDVEQAGAVHADLALVDTDLPNALAFEHGGRPVVAISLSWLARLGEDRDALATTIGHELAHIHLGHSGSARRKREQTAATTGTIVGTLLNLTGVPLGNVASLGVTAYARSFTRDEERAADEAGLRWAVAAGYDPCGRVRTMKMYQSLGAGGTPIPFLSTHPGAGERSALATELSMQTRNRGCED